MLAYGVGIMELWFHFCNDKKYTSLLNLAWVLFVDLRIPSNSQTDKYNL
jgi:hypothetical protein